MASNNEINPADLNAWVDWAFAEADRLDPVVSGQVQTHLKPPTLD